MAKKRTQKGSERSASEWAPVSQMTTASIEAQSAISKLSRLSIAHPRSAEINLLLFDVCKKIVVAIVTNDDARITELLKQTARAYGGSTSLGTTKAARVRRAASYLELFEPMNGRRVEIDPPSLRQMLQRGSDARFAELADENLSTAIQKMKDGGSVSGVLADLVVSCGAFEMNTTNRRSVQATLAKWLVKKRNKK